MGIATMMIFYANSLTNFGFNNALIQKKEINEKHISSVFTIDIIISLILTIGIIFLSHHIAVFFHMPELTNVLLVLSPIFIITSFYQMPITLMKRDVNFRVTSLTEFYQGIIQSVVTLVLAFLGYRYWSLVIGFVVSYTLGTLYIIFKVKWKPEIKYVHEAMKDIFNFGMWNFMRAQMYYISGYADKFIVGKFLGAAFLGLYEKAYSIVAMQKESFSMPFNAVMFSSFSRIQSKDNDQIKQHFKKALSISAVICFAVNMGLFLLGTHFVMVLLGSKWEPMISSLKIFSIAFVFIPLNGLIASLNIGMGSYKEQAIREGVCSILLIIVCLLVVQNGIEYIAFGFLFTSFLQFILTFQLTKKDINIGWLGMAESLRPAIISSLIMASMILFSKKFFLHETNAVNFIMLLGIGCSSYILAILVPNYHILEEFRKPIINRIRYIFNRIFVISSR